MNKAHHQNPYRTVGVVLMSLLLLLGIAVGIYFISGIPAKFAVTILIASLKAFLVIWFFMRARESRGITPFFIAAGFIWLGILVLLTGIDYLTR